MELAVFNACLYFVPFLFYLIRRRRIDSYFVLLFTYSTVAIMCALYKYSEPKEYVNCTLLSYVYLYICVMISLSPFRNLKIRREDLVLIDNHPMKIITWTFVIAGYINLFIGVPHTINLIQTGDWGMLRTLSYEGDAQLSQNIFQYIAGNIFGYLSPIGIVICFCELIKDKKNKFLLFSLFFVWIGTDFMAAANIASRSMVADRKSVV